MSTVCEVIAARALGLRVLGFSSIANAAGVVGLSHVDVLSAVERGAEDLARLVAAILAGL
jgi:purine-nucleoside phosphorylase